MMKSLCQSLDILQYEEKAYYGILLPTLAFCTKKLTDILEANDLAVCKPVLSAILKGLKDRFQPCIKNMDCLQKHFILISGCHGFHFFLCLDVKRLLVFALSCSKRWCMLSMTILQPMYPEQAPRAHILTMNISEERLLQSPKKKSVLKSCLMTFKRGTRIAKQSNWYVATQCDR